MAKPRSQGRMIRIDIAEDEGLAKLSDGAARLYFHLTPFLSSHGKFSGGPHTIRENVVPRLPWTAKRINGYLVEINNHTSMRIWKQFGRIYVHDITFFQKQEIREDRRGQDTLPSYPGPSVMNTSTSGKSLPEVLPELLPPEVEVEVKDKKKEKLKSALPLPPLWGGGAAVDPSPYDVSPPPNGTERKGSHTALDEDPARTPEEHELIMAKIRAGVLMVGAERNPPVGNIKTTPTLKGTPDIRAATVSEAKARLQCKEWTLEKAIERLVFLGFNEKEAQDALTVKTVT